MIISITCVALSSVSREFIYLHTFYLLFLLHYTYGFIITVIAIYSFLLLLMCIILLFPDKTFIFLLYQIFSKLFFSRAKDLRETVSLPLQDKGEDCVLPNFPKPNLGGTPLGWWLLLLLTLFPINSSSTQSVCKYKYLQQVDN